MSRTNLQRKIAKQLLKKPVGKFEAIDLSTAANTPDWITRAYRNNRYVVMINDNARVKGHSVIKAMVQRHDDKPIPNHWRELQTIKNQIFGKVSTAVEFYPPESELVDMANIYWLWILPPNWQLTTDLKSITPSLLIQPDITEEAICDLVYNLIEGIVPDNMTPDQSAVFFRAMAITAIETLKKHQGIDSTAGFLEKILQDTTETTELLENFELLNA